MMAVRLLCSLRPRRRIAILGTACTGVVAGLFIFNKVLPRAVESCRLSCSTAETPSYAFLRGNEARLIMGDHPLISAVDVNYLSSNDPNEDRFVAGGSRELSMGLFAVLDGHKGHHCSDYLRRHLLDHLMKGLANNGLVKDPHVDLYSLNSSEHPYSTVQLPPSPDQHELQSFEELVKQVFVSLDKEMCDTALAAVRQVHKGRSIRDGSLKSDILKGIAGACALLATVNDSTLTVASTGDCRAVVGTRGGGGGWSAVPMSLDQNAENKEEVNRLIKAHPHEEKTLIMMGRLLGNLMPLRAFGDVEYKWDIKDLDSFLQIPMFYLTPPYLTAEPVVNTRKVEKNDRFLVLATDGLWERLNNDQVVKIVGELVDSKELFNRQSRFSWFRRGNKVESGENAATHLLWESLGGEEGVVNQLIHVSAPYSRTVRDDITIIVIHFHDK